MNLIRAFFILLITFSFAFAKPTVALSTFALYDIAKNITGDSVELFKILPDGTSAHTFEPTPKDMVKLSKSSIVFYSGAGLEPWIKRFKFSSKSVDISEFVKLREVDDDHHHHSHFDPHYWLDISNMILATNKIKDELIELFPKNRELFSKNATIYIEKLKELDEEYKQTLSSCKLDTIILNHNAFSYLAHRYGFKSASLSGLSPEDEPNAKKMIELVKFIKSNGVKVIFGENFASKKAIQSIAAEAGVDVDLLQPIGNITADEVGLGYIDIMKTNLVKISKALECR
ncbi:MAG: metal ABC transporter substrate-binding protein [Sulfurimonas sp.]